MPFDDDPNHRGGSRRWIIQEVENSLRRLGTDWIDLYQIHRYDPAVDLDETLGALTDLVRSGKVRYIGHSTYPASAIVDAQWTARDRGRERFVTEQPPYSILTRGIENEVLPVCQRYGMGVIPYSPLAGGWLSGRYRTDADAGPTSVARKRLANRFDLDLPANQRKLEAAEQFVGTRRRRRPDADPAGDRVRSAPPGGDRSDHRPAHHGTPRVPARRRRRRAHRRRAGPHRRDRAARRDAQPRRQRMGQPFPGARGSPSVTHVVGANHQLNKGPCT